MRALRTVPRLNRPNNPPAALWLCEEALATLPSLAFKTFSACPPNLPASPPAHVFSEEAAALTAPLLVQSSILAFSAAPISPPTAPLCERDTAPRLILCDNETKCCACPISPPTVCRAETAPVFMQAITCAEEEAAEAANSATNPPAMALPETAAPFSQRERVTGPVAWQIKPAALSAETVPLCKVQLETRSPSWPSSESTAARAVPCTETSEKTRF